MFCTKTNNFQINFKPHLSAQYLHFFAFSQMTELLKKHQTASSETGTQYLLAQKSHTFTFTIALANVDRF